MTLEIQGKTYQAKLDAGSLVLQDAADVIVFEEEPNIVVFEDEQALKPREAKALGVRLVQASITEIGGLAQAGYRLPWAPLEAHEVRP